MLRLLKTLPGLPGRLPRRFAATGAPPACPAGSGGVFHNLHPGRPAGRFGGRPARRPEFMGRLRGLGRAFGQILFTLLLFTGLATAATPPGTPIDNQATVGFTVSGVPQPPVDSNIVTLTVRSPANIRFFTYAPSLPTGTVDLNVPPTYYQNGGSDTLIPAPPETATQPMPLVETLYYLAGSPIYLRLEDLDQNSDPATRQTVLVTVTGKRADGTILDTEELRLTESEPNSGIFTGYLLSASGGASGADGTLRLETNCRIEASYIDAFDETDKDAFDAALVDPFGYVFDSASGVPLKGALVRLIDRATGMLAKVYGDASGNCPIDQTSQPFFSGGSVIDDCGVRHDFTDPGSFRFPFVADGGYQLVVTPPDGYTVPTTVSEAQLQSRSWWGSSGYVTNEGWLNGQWTGTFDVIGSIIRIDIPADPLSSYLWLQKDVSRDIASTGDFLKYTLTLENQNGISAAPGVTISDRLPLGFRYQKGSTRIRGVKIADPAISADGRTLTFTLGDVSPAGSVEVTYVIEVAAGAKAGKAVNTARAVDANGIASLPASRMVTVRDEFFRDAAILVGRVLEGACSEEDTAMRGVPGVRVYLEDGSYVVTDKDGKYHFEGVEPGVHVVQVDTVTLPAGYQMLPCEQTSQFAGRTFSQFVDLKGGSLWRVNFYAAPKPPPTGTAGIALKAALDGRQADLAIDLTARGVTVTNLRATVMLPAGARYLPGTAARDGQRIDDPQIFDETVTFRLPALEADRNSVITFRADLSGAAVQGDLPAKVLLTFDSPSAKNQRTPLAEILFQGVSQELITSEEIRLFPRFPSFVAELQDTDLAMLEQLAAQLQSKKIVRIDLVGHADTQEIAPRSQHIFADNQALSVARAQSVADFLSTRLVLPSAAVNVRGMGDTLPLTDNTSDEGRALNRRVDLLLVSEHVERREDLVLAQPASPEQTAATTGSTPLGRPILAQALPLAPIPEEPRIDQEWLTAARPDALLVWPPAGYVPETPSTGIMVQHRKGQTVAVTLNGQTLPPLNYDGVVARQDGKVAVASWRGVDLAPGRNLIEAVIVNDLGQVIGRDSREIWYVSTPARAELLPDRSRLVADGIAPPSLAVRLSDHQGHPVRPGIYVEPRVAPPFRTLLGDPGQDDPTLTQGTGKSRFKTGADGVVMINLEPTTQSGEVNIELPLNDQSVQFKAWLKPAPRDWILVGFAQGTIGYSTISDNQVGAAETGIEEHGYTDGQVKFFAKGAIKGEWLLTLAYDSDKPDRDGDSLRQIIDPDTYYPLYGDETSQGYEAASADNLYVKLERDQFQVLFGDMQTGLTQTVLSQYSRSMNGFKVEQQGERFAYTVFAADTRQAFVKDELRGDGTAGRYALSQKALVINSEEVVIETRDRFHAARIVKEERLSRHLDYDIDYEAGTLYFKRPVPSRDENLDPVFVVVRYETRAANRQNWNYGGRAAVSSTDRRIEAGASLVHEQSGAAKGDLYGADVTVQLTPQTTLRAEVATTDVETSDETRRGDAYLAEVEHRGAQLDGRAWFRRQDEQFGLGQQGGGTGGMRSYGVDGAWRLDPRLSLAGELWHEDNLATDAKRDVGSVQALYRADRYGLNTGLREARDTFSDGAKRTSRQLLFGGDWTTSDRKLTLRATHEQSLGGSNANSDFPTRTLLGADYRLSESVSLFAEQEFTWGDQADTEGTRVGLKSTPWRGGEIRTTMERQTVEDGERIFAVFGLGQSWQLTRHWSVDLSVDRSYTVKNKPAGERVNPGAPRVHGGDDDFTAVSIGAAYKAEKWSWWNRLETRQGDSEDKVGISSGVVGEVRDGVAVSAKLMAFIADSAGGNRRDEEEITLGLAYRPDRSKWIILERLDLSLYNQAGDGGNSDGMRIVNHIHASYRASRQWQTSLYYGLKYVRENFDGDTFDGYTDMIAVETRYNLNSRWDIGVHGALLHSWNSHQLQYSLGADVGCMVMTNAWVSAGYNLVGFEDNDFSAANYTAQGPYVRLRMKFDQQSVKEAAAWLNK